MSQDNTPPRDGSPRDQDKDGVPPAPATGPAGTDTPASGTGGQTDGASGGQQPEQPPVTGPDKQPEPGVGQQPVWGQQPGMVAGQAPGLPDPERVAAAPHQQDGSPNQQTPPAPWASPSGLQPDPAPELDPDFVPDPGTQPDPAMPPSGGQAPTYASAYPGQQPYAGQEPYPGQQPYPGQDAPPEPNGDPVKRQRLVIGGIVVGVLVLIGVVIWVLLNLLGTRPEAAVTTPSATATPGPLPRDANSKDFQVGDCFADFDPNASEARAVACDTEHSAQLIGIHVYPGDDSFPGSNALREKGREVCKAAVGKLNKAAENYVLLQQNVYPSTTSWDRGDRRLDCFIVVDSGNTIKEDLLQK